MPLNPAFTGLIAAHLDAAVARAAREAASVIHFNLDQPGHGEKWPKLPNRSSAPDEFPARQFDALINSIDAERAGLGEWQVGSFNGPSEAVRLEFKQIGGATRPWLSRSMEDPAMHEKMLAAIGGGDLL